VPIVEAVTKAGNKSPYQQFGKTYYVMSDSLDYSETGVASWYGSKFHGRRTSNGDIYDMYAMTAAHKTLPIPTYVRVTNLDNKKSIIVRVNDRGPFHNERIIDLSYAAASKLEFSTTGTANVFIEAIDPGTSSIEQYQTSKKTYLQIGSFDNPESAIQMASKANDSITTPAVIKALEGSYKVVVGPIANNRELLLIKRTLMLKYNISAFTVTL